MAKINISFGGELQGEQSFDEPVVVVGREPSCQIHIDNLGISRTHCQFIQRGNTYVLQDMNSANGTYVNGNKIGEHTLQEGDEILIGKYSLKFSYASGGTSTAAAKKPAEPADAFGDAVHTYVMDGQKIRERLDKMREHNTASSAESSVKQGTSKLPAPGTAQFKMPTKTTIPAPPPKVMPRKAMDHALDFDPLKPHSKQHAAGGGADGGMRLVLYLSLATNMVLIILVGALAVLLFRFMQAHGPAPDPAPASAIEAPAQDNGDDYLEDEDYEEEEAERWEPLRLDNQPR